MSLHQPVEKPLHAAVVEIPERVAADGTILTSLSEQRAEAILTAAFAHHGDIPCVIALLHADRYSDHERTVASIAAKVGFSNVLVSHRVQPQLGYFSRTNSSVIDGYLSQVISQYKANISRDVSPRSFIMQSSGGVCTLDQASGVRMLFSGPAGGVQGALKIADPHRRSPEEGLIGFDMGGTSTDIWFANPSVFLKNQTAIGGFVTAQPSLDVHTTAAGGGSRLEYALRALQGWSEECRGVPRPSLLWTGRPRSTDRCGAANRTPQRQRPASQTFPHPTVAPVSRHRAA